MIDKIAANERNTDPVAYKHRTLPTKRIGEITVVGDILKKR